MALKSALATETTSGVANAPYGAVDGPETGQEEKPMPTNPTRKPNPDRYARLSVPHATQEAAQDDIDAFAAVVGELRERHKLTDVVIVIQTPVLTDGPDSPARARFWMGHMGAESEVPFMLARALGCAEQQRQEALARLASGEDGGEEDGGAGEADGE